MSEATDLTVESAPSVHRVPARRGLAVDVTAGDHVSIVDADGGQVGDFFAFNRHDPSEYLSASHTRAFNSALFPSVGQAFLSSRRRPMLTVVADTSPGYHDMLIAACDPARYEQLGVEGWHASCAENLTAAMANHGIEITHVPQPFNVFMRTPALADGTIAWLPAESEPGDRFEMRAEMDLVVALSSCPSELSGINTGELSDLIIEIHPAPGTA
jgi:uncharacterized protein YcgI (DUF1989 family)